MTAPLFVFAFSVAVPRTARRIFRKKENARGAPGNSCGRGLLLSRQFRTLVVHLLRPCRVSGADVS